VRIGAVRTECGPFGRSSITEGAIERVQSLAIAATEACSFVNRVGDEAGQECGIAAVTFALRSGARTSTMLRSSARVNRWM
jgi:hypothetical protein